MSNQLRGSLEQAASRCGQGRMASGRAILTRRLYRHQLGSACRARGRLLTTSAARRAIRKEGKNAIKSTRLSCRSFAANALRLQLHVPTYNLGNFMRTLAMPKTAQPWSLTSLREKLIKIGAKVVSHGRYVTFQMAEAAVSRVA